MSNALGSPGMLSVWIPVAVLLLLWAWRSPRPLLERGLRISAVLAITTALLFPTFDRQHTETKLTLLVDTSSSMNDEQAESLLARARSLGSLTVIPFARRVGSDRPDRSERFATLRDRTEHLDPGKTDLAAGLTAATQRSNQNVILLSDGYPTRGNLEEALLQLAQRGVRIFPLVGEDAAAPELFSITQLSAPAFARRGRSVAIRTTIKNSTTSTQRGKLALVTAGKPLSTKEVELTPGEEIVLIAESDPSAEGIQEITATLTPASSALAPSQKRLFLSNQEGERVLLLSGLPEDGQYLREALTNQAYRLEIADSPEELSRVRDLSLFSAVILNNVALSQLPASFAANVQNFVAAGGGLLAIGGNRSFGLGGYKDTPIEEALPVDCLPPQTKLKRVNVAVQLVLDKSRSMSNDNKLEYAKEAAREVIRNLKDEDYVGIVGFDAAPFVAVRLGLLRDIRDTALDRVGRIISAGPTNMLPAIDEARRALARVEAGRKHVIVLTDGKIPDEGPYYLEMMRQMRDLGMTVSTVLLGGEYDTGMLRDMAQLGGGSFYQTSSASNLPRIFLQDIRVSSGEQTMRESQYLVRLGPGTLESTSTSSFPTLKGYVQTRVKGEANLELIVYANQRAEPLLASWRYKRGRSVAFTSDANGRWSSPWIAWSPFSTFWGDILQSIRKSSQGDAGNDGTIDFDVRSFVEDGALILELAIFSDTQASQVSADIELPNGSHLQRIFERRSMGRYQIRLEDPEAGAYTVRTQYGATALQPVKFAVDGAALGERSEASYNRPLLERIASVTGGVLNPTPDDLRALPSVVNEKVDLISPLMILAALCLLLEILLREVWDGRLPRKSLRFIIGSSTRL